MKSFREYLTETAETPLVNKNAPTTEAAAPQKDEVAFRPPLNAEEVVKETSNEAPNIQRLMLTQEEQLAAGDKVRLKSNRHVRGKVAKIDETLVYFNTDNGSTFVSNMANLIKEDSFVPKDGKLLKEKGVEEEITDFKEPSNSRGSYDDFEHHRKMHHYHTHMTDWHLAHSVTQRSVDPINAQHHKEMARIHDGLAQKHHHKLYEEQSTPNTPLEKNTGDKKGEKVLKSKDGDEVIINPLMKADVSQGISSTQGTGGKGFGAQGGTQG